MNIQCCIYVYIHVHTSSHTKENSQNLGDECSQPRHMRNLDPVQVALDLWDTTTSCHRLHTYSPGRQQQHMYMYIVYIHVYKVRVKKEVTVPQSNVTSKLRYF